MGKKKKKGIKSTEKITSNISKLLEDKEFESVEEVREYLNQFTGKSEMPPVVNQTPLRRAQDIIYEAWDFVYPADRVEAAHEALEISKDCADAYVILAEDAATSWEETKDYYMKGIKAGERALGKKNFEEYKGHFWGFTKSRPYMRARRGHAHALWKLGRHEEAIENYRDMLELNPGDNQGIRYILAACYAEDQRWDDLEKLFNMEKYKNDCAADWIYSEALLAYVKNGSCEETNKLLLVARKYNAHVPDYLVGKKIPSEKLPDRITLGGESEAMCYGAVFLEAWKKVPGAIEWLKKQTKDKIVGRNDPCSCGSGKKYKYCCGNN